MQIYRKFFNRKKMLERSYTSVSCTTFIFSKKQSVERKYAANLCQKLVAILNKKFKYWENPEEGWCFCFFFILLYRPLLYTFYTLLGLFWPALSIKESQGKREEREAQLNITG